MAITKILIDGKWHDKKEYYKCLDISEVYEKELDDLEVTSLDDEQMKTFLFECLDEEVDFVWEMIKSQYSCNDMHLIDFESSYLHDDHQIQVKLNDDFSVIVTVNIKFNINYNVNNPRYDDTGCYHQYKAFSVAMNKYKDVKEIENLEVA